MTGTEKIIAHIEDDARKQAEAILAEAEEKCAAVRADFEEQAKKLYSEKIRDGVKACQDREDGALRIARMEARKSVLAVKQEMVSKSFDLAREQILSLPEEDYVAFLKKLALSAGLTGDEEILLNAGDREKIGAKLIEALKGEGKTLKLSDETADIAGGLILRRGNVETNCSVELLVELSRAELSGKLAELLFA